MVVISNGTKSRVDEKIYRTIDANYNRCKEGLRVCEDIARFVLDDKHATRQLKMMRHTMTELLKFLNTKTLIQTRAIERDVGRLSTTEEFKRKDVKDIFYANAQRVKESVRVLEEFTKLVNKSHAGKLKTIRYTFYSIEKKIISAL